VKKQLKAEKETELSDETMLGADVLRHYWTYNIGAARLTLEALFTLSFKINLERMPPFQPSLSPPSSLTP